MKKLIAVLMILALAGCAPLTIQAPDGTIIKYSSFMASTDDLQVTSGATTIKLKSKTNLDPATVNAILGGALAK
jgi:hypothetical protein